MFFADYFYRVEKSINDAIRSCYPASWNEDHITFTVTDNLFMKNQDVSLEGLNRPFKIKWDVRKLRRPEETKYGDVGVLVRLTTWADETIEGVGLLEAKRRDTGKTTFSSAKVQQLKRILSSAPAARLMLYDYEDVTACMDNRPGQFEYCFYKEKLENNQPFTHCICVPANIALQTGKFTTQLHKFGVPFSYQLIGRYFRGFDLEMDKKIVEAVKKNAIRHGGPRTLLLVGISTGAKKPILPEVDRDLYE